MNTFQLTIELGNDAMQTPADVAAALRDVAEAVESCRLRPAATWAQPWEPWPRMGKMRDTNGNTVGSWEFS